jgi:uncharacterized protein (TIGR02145 family)
MLQIIPNILIISKITVIISLINQMTRMFTFKKLSFLLTVCLVLHVSLFGQVTNNVEPQKENGFDRKSNFNVEELKVRWKKAALENCPGVPCTIVPPPPSFTCGTSTVTDIDNNIYNTVLIGNQCWTRENLKVTKYNDGTFIGDSTTSTWGTALIGARTGWDVSVVPLSDYVGTFGYLYNWYAATDTRKLCPTGWHVPTDPEWTILIQTLDPSQGVDSTNVLSFIGIQSTIAGTVMKSTTTNTSMDSGLGWNPAIPASPGTNTSGFTALPSGLRSAQNIFANVRDIAFFWSATEMDLDKAWNRLLRTDGIVTRSTTRNDDKSVGGSVRCLKD